MGDCEAQGVAASHETVDVGADVMEGLKADAFSPTNAIPTTLLSRLARLAKSWGAIAAVGSIAVIAGASVGLLTASQLFSNSSKEPFSTPPPSNAGTTATVVSPTASSVPLHSSHNSTLQDSVVAYNTSKSTASESIEEYYYQLPGFQAVCGDGVCSFSERCSSCVQDCGLCSSGRIIAHYVVASTQPNSTLYKTDMNLAQKYGIDAFALQVDAWPGTGPNYEAACDALFDAADQLVDFKLFFILPLNQLSLAFNTAIVTRMLSKYAARPSYLYLNGKQVLSTMGGIVERPWDWYTWLYAQSNAGNPIYFMPGFYSNVPMNQLKWQYFYVDGYLNLNTWKTDNQTLVELNARESIITQYINGQYIPSISAWYAKGSTVKGNHGFLAIERWQHILSIQQNISHVYITSWNDYSDATYLNRGDGSSLVKYNHLPMLELQSYYMTAFRQGAYPAIQYETIYYYYRLYHQHALVNETNSFILPDVSIQDDMYMVLFLLEPGTLQVNSGDKMVQWNTTAGITLLSTPFQAGVQTLTLTRGTVNVLSSTGKYTIENQTRQDEFSFNYYINKMRESY